MFSYSLLFDIDYHELFIKFMNNLKQNTKFPALKLSVKRKEPKFKEKYLRVGIDSSLLLLNS